ncbi:MAG: prolipoprotein diacylglyceryl transferase, partial [Candidatus Komeilibacteria bacterium]|nr:prolipoprotein diacylglyceryl transferase [Candidatus Komeilibacteria bacterium]
MWWQLSAPSRVLLDLGPIKIYWYGLFVVAGIVLALVVILKVAAQKKYDLDKVFNLLFYVIIFGLIGARVWEVVGYSWTYFKTEPWAILK